MPGKLLNSDKRTEYESSLVNSSHPLDHRVYSCVNSVLRANSTSNSASPSVDSKVDSRVHHQSTDINVSPHNSNVSCFHNLNQCALLSSTPKSQSTYDPASATLSSSPSLQNDTNLDDFLPYSISPEHQAQPQSLDHYSNSPADINLSSPLSPATIPVIITHNRDPHPVCVSPQRTSSLQTIRRSNKAVTALSLPNIG